MVPRLNQGVLRQKSSVTEKESVLEPPADPLQVALGRVRAEKHAAHDPPLPLSERFGAMQDALPFEQQHRIGMRVRAHLAAVRHAVPVAGATRPGGVSVHQGQQQRESAPLVVVVVVVVSGHEILGAGGGSAGIWESSIL